MSFCVFCETFASFARSGQSAFRGLRTPRRTHAATDAHGDDDALGAAALAFDEGVAGQALAGDAVGVAHGDGAAVDVQAVAGMPSLSRQ
jgi:hypothetical protein